MTVNLQERQRYREVGKSKPLGKTKVQEGGGSNLQEGKDAGRGWGGGE